MKACNVVLIVLAMVVTASAADTVTEKLQRGLFEEEANHNLSTAMKEYQAIIAQSDEQRKVVATALFRLAECYRKLGQTNEAAKAYQQVLRDYSEQEQLVQMAEKLTRAEEKREESSAQLREMESKMAGLRIDLAAADNEWRRLTRMSDTGLARTDAAKKDPVLVTLEQQLLAAEQKRAELLGGGKDSKHPEVQAVE